MKKVVVLTVVTVLSLGAVGCNRGWDRCWNRGEPCSEVYSQPAAVGGAYSDYGVYGGSVLEADTLPQPTE